MAYRMNMYLFFLPCLFLRPAIRQPDMIKHKKNNRLETSFYFFFFNKTFKTF